MVSYQSLASGGYGPPANAGEALVAWKRAIPCCRPYRRRPRRHGGAEAWPSWTWPGAPRAASGAAQSRRPRRSAPVPGNLVPETAPSSSPCTGVSMFSGTRHGGIERRDGGVERRHGTGGHRHGGTERRDGGVERRQGGRGRRHRGRERVRGRGDTEITAIHHEGVGDCCKDRMTNGCSGEREDGSSRITVREGNLRITDILLDAVSTVVELRAPDERESVRSGSEALSPPFSRLRLPWSPASRRCMPGERLRRRGCSSR